jgi:PilZ domain
MTQEQRQLEDKRGLRFPFKADAEVVLPSSPDKIPARVTELSFRGCFLEISITLQEKQRIRVKIFHSDDFFESSAEVIYVRPNGVGLVFGNMEPPLRKVLQAWILAALDAQAKSKRR